jgi:hypothetical protein
MIHVGISPGRGSLGCGTAHGDVDSHRWYDTAVNHIPAPAALK